MSSTPSPVKIDANDIPTLAPDVVVTRGDRDAARPAAVSVPPKGADAAADAKAPPVDTTFRAASPAPAKTASPPPVTEPARKSFGRRLMRGVVGMILTACVAGGAVLWQSHGDAVRQIVTKAVGPLVQALLSRESPTPEPASPVVQTSAVGGGSAPQTTANDANSAQASSPPDTRELLNSLARELAHMRQDMDQMKGAIAELKASDDQMAREIAKVSDRTTDKALEQALRPRASTVSPPQAQPVAMPARKPPPPMVGRPVQPRPVSATVTPRVATSYVPRLAEPRTVAPPPQSPAGPPPMDLAAPPRPPGSLREQVP